MSREIGIEIPLGMLKEETLLGLAESYVLREGTDYGEREFSLAEKVSQLLRAVKEGRMKLFYDAASQSCNFVATE